LTSFISAPIFNILKPSFGFGLGGAFFLFLFFLYSFLSKSLKLMHVKSCTFLAIGFDLSFDFSLYFLLYLDFSLVFSFGFAGLSMGSASLAGL